MLDSIAAVSIFSKIKLKIARKILLQIFVSLGVPHTLQWIVSVAAL